MTVDQALKECAALTKQHSSTFFLGSAFFHGDRRRAVSAVYATCRLGDDAVDAAPDEREGRARLAAWWSGVERAYAGRPDDAVAFELALAWALERYDLPRTAFEELHLGLETDLERVDLDTIDDLLLYWPPFAGVF
jgi:15-cis-phytoene synthase